MSDVSTVAPVKRGRGRPRKNPLPTASAEVAAPAKAAPERDVDIIAREFGNFLASDTAKSSYLFDQNDESTRVRILTMCVRVLQGYLTARGKPYYAVNVTCNESNNTVADAIEYRVIVDVVYAVTQQEHYRIRYAINTSTAKVTYEVV